MITKTSIKMSHHNQTQAHMVTTNNQSALTVVPTRIDAMVSHNYSCDVPSLKTPEETLEGEYARFCQDISIIKLPDENIEACLSSCDKKDVNLEEEYRKFCHEVTSQSRSSRAEATNNGLTLENNFNQDGNSKKLTISNAIDTPLKDKNPVEPLYPTNKLIKNPPNKSAIECYKLFKNLVEQRCLVKDKFSFFSSKLIKDSFENVQLFKEMLEQPAKMTKDRFCIVCHERYPKVLLKNLNSLQKQLNNFLSQLPFKPAIGKIKIDVGRLKVYYGNDATFKWLQKIVVFNQSVALKLFSSREIPNFFFIFLNLPSNKTKNHTNKQILNVLFNENSSLKCLSWKITCRFLNKSDDNLTIIIDNLSIITLKKLYSVNFYSKTYKLKTYYYNNNLQIKYFNHCSKEETPSELEYYNIASIGNEDATPEKNVCHKNQVVTNNFSKSTEENIALQKLDNSCTALKGAEEIIDSDKTFSSKAKSTRCSVLADSDDKVAVDNQCLPNISLLNSDDTVTSENSSIADQQNKNQSLTEPLLVGSEDLSISATSLADSDGSVASQNSSLADQQNKFSRMNQLERHFIDSVPNIASNKQFTTEPPLLDFNQKNPTITDTKKNNQNKSKHTLGTDSSEERNRLKEKKTLDNFFVKMKIKPEDASCRKDTAIANYKKFQLLFQSRSNDGFSFFHKDILNNTVKNIILLDQMSVQPVDMSSQNVLIVSHSNFPKIFFNNFNLNLIKNRLIYFLNLLPVPPAIGKIVICEGWLQMHYGNHASLKWMENVVRNTKSTIFRLKVLTRKQIPDFCFVYINLPINRVINIAKNDILKMMEKENVGKRCYSWSIARRVADERNKLEELIIVMDATSFEVLKKYDFRIAYCSVLYEAKPYEGTIIKNTEEFPIEIVGNRVRAENCKPSSGKEERKNRKESQKVQDEDSYAAELENESSFTNSENLIIVHDSLPSMENSFKDGKSNSKVSIDAMQACEVENVQLAGPSNPLFNRIIEAPAEARVEIKDAQNVNQVPSKNSSTCVFNNPVLQNTQKYRTTHLSVQRVAEVNDVHTNMESSKHNDNILKFYEKILSSSNVKKTLDNSSRQKLKYSDRKDDNGFSKSRSMSRERSTSRDDLKKSARSNSRSRESRRSRDDPSRSLSKSSSRRSSHCRTRSRTRSPSKPEERYKSKSRNRSSSHKSRSKKKKSHPKYLERSSRKRKRSRSRRRSRKSSSNRMDQCSCKKSRRNKSEISPLHTVQKSRSRSKRRSSTLNGSSSSETSEKDEDSCAPERKHRRCKSNNKSKSKSDGNCKNRKCRRNTSQNSRSKSKLSSSEISSEEEELPESSEKSEISPMTDILLDDQASLNLEVSPNPKTGCIENLKKNIEVKSNNPKSPHRNLGEEKLLSFLDELRDLCNHFRNSLAQPNVEKEILMEE